MPVDPNNPWKVDWCDGAICDVESRLLRIKSSTDAAWLQRAEKPPRFFLQIGNYGLMLHTNATGPQCSYVQPANASRYDCLHELQAAMRKHQVPAGATIISE